MKPFLKIVGLLVGLLSNTLVFGLDASVSYATFYATQQPYVEVYLHVSGRSVTFTPVADSSFQAAVEVLVLFKQAGEIVKYDKYQLNSPVTRRYLDFVDLKRYGLAAGSYDLVVTVSDVNQPENLQTYQIELNLAFPESGLLQSDIELLASIHKSAEGATTVFSKNGLELEPLPYQFYGRGANTLYFYHEIYRSDAVIGEPFAVSYLVEKLGGSQAETVVIGHKRQDPQPVNAIVQQVDISKLPSGNYRLALEVRDRNKQLLSRQTVDFQRSNPLVDLENLEFALAGADPNNEFVASFDQAELKYGLLAILPHLPQQDIEVVNLMIRNDSLRAQRLYLYSFWARENPSDPKGAYDRYMEVARAVDQKFHSGFRYGFETDRGYVYLKYGQPNDIVRQENEPSAPPYEVWSYEEVKRTNQNNVRFIFYNPSLASDDFVLLHSDVYGERQNPQWQLDLYRAAPGDHPQDFIQGTDVNDNIGRRARQTITDW